MAIDCGSMTSSRKRSSEEAKVPDTCWNLAKARHRSWTKWWLRISPHCVARRRRCGNELTATVRRNSRNYHNKLINNRNISDQYLAILDPVIYRITAQALLYMYNRAPVCINTEVSGAPPFFPKRDAGHPASHAGCARDVLKNYYPSDTIMKLQYYSNIQLNTKT